MPPLFTSMKARLLGVRYDLSFAYIGPSKMRTLNRRYRHTNKPTDILVFPLDRDRGEMVMCKSAIAKKARDSDMGASDYARFLFIHGALHLKGYAHGRIMERLEDRWCGVFRIPLPLRDGTTHRRH